MDTYKMQQIAQMFPGLMRPPGLELPPGLETSSNFDCLTSLGVDSCELFPTLTDQLQAKVQRPPGHASLSALQIAAVKSKLLPPPGNFRSRPLRAGQPVPFTPPGCFHTDMPCKQPMRPPGNWDTMSLASTGVGDDGSVPSMGSLPELSEELDDLMHDEEIKSKLKRVRFGPVETVLYEEGLSLPDFAAHLCKAKPPLADRLPERKDYTAHEGRLEQTDTREPVTLQWTVDAKKLKSSDRSIISPNLEISPHDAVKLIIKPTSIGDARGQANFRNSQGVGSLELKFTKSLSCAPKIRFCVAVGDQEWRGPFEHDFSRNSLCTLPKDMREWDFPLLVKPKSSTFLVSLQLLGITRCAD